MTAEPAGISNGTTEFSAEAHDPKHIFVIVALEAIATITGLITLGMFVFSGQEPSSTLVFAVGLTVANLTLMGGVTYFAYTCHNMSKQNSILRQLRARLSAEATSYQAARQDWEAAYSNTNGLISHDRMMIAYAQTSFSLDSRKAMREPNSIDLAHCFQLYMRNVLDDTARLFSNYTGKTCAASIKLFDAEQEESASGKQLQGEGYIRTLMRDQKSTQLRDPIDDGLERYEYWRNTAFYSIYAMEAEPDFYVGENLERLAAEGKYDNFNKNWQKYYDAVAVVPIRPAGKNVQTHCVAFLCVDNKGGGFARELDRCVNILNGIATDLYYGINTATLALGKLHRGITHA